MQSVLKDRKVAHDEQHKPPPSAAANDTCPSHSSQWILAFRQALSVKLQTVALSAVTSSDCLMMFCRLLLLLLMRPRG
jgi:hypothetical protein